MNRRSFLKTGIGVVIAGMTVPSWARARRELPEATPWKLPRWRGFNLLEKFTPSNQRAFLESDFEWLAAWGFDFVRLPMDYRCWAKTPEAEFNEQTMREIDQAVEFGKQYGVHVNLNFHRGPGYCVNMRSDEKPTLWTELASQEQFARHWGVFAARYKGIPSRQLSFDLINEPADITGAVYAAAMKPAIETIRAADPQRLIIADGIEWGTKPVPELVPFGVAQSTRGYEPMLISHYRAPWIQFGKKLPPPSWPVPAGMNVYLCGSDKPDLHSALVLRAPCARATAFSIHVAQVSAHAELIVKADGVVVLQKEFHPASGAGEWKKSVANQWGGFDADYDRDYTATIPAGAKEIQIEVGNGDWLTFSEIRLGGVSIHPTNTEWGVKQEPFIVDERGVRPEAPHFIHSKETLQKNMIEPWKKLEAQGVGVHVGEWGAYHFTPHAVTLAWMRDCLTNWKRAGWGWALWNFRGSFGVLDSERRDVVYEGYKGHKLDRKMLELLREL